MTGRRVVRVIAIRVSPSGIMHLRNMGWAPAMVVAGVFSLRQRCVYLFSLSVRYQH
jgi:hypothetical protein